MIAWCRESAVLRDRHLDVLRDHPPPHFHAQYGEHEATIVIATRDLLEGSLPRRALGLVREWAQLHEDKLRANWERARAREALERIEPLP